MKRLRLVQLVVLCVLTVGMSCELNGADFDEEWVDLGPQPILRVQAVRELVLARRVQVRNDNERKRRACEHVNFPARGYGRLGREESVLGVHHDQEKAARAAWLVRKRVRGK